MKTCADQRVQLLRVLGHGIGVLALLALAACRGEGPTAPQTPSAPTAFQGAIAGPTGESGVITLTTATMTTVAPAPRAVAAVSSAVIQDLTGTLKLVGGATINLTGTFDTGAGAIAVSGGGYAFTGTLSNGSVSGTYTGPNGTGTFAAAPSGATTPTIQVFCGTYSGTDMFSGTPHAKYGVWNLVRSGNTLVGVTEEISGGGAGTTVNGQLSGIMISLKFYIDGILAGSGEGTLSGTSVSGTYVSTDGLASGTWSGDESCSTRVPAASVSVTPASASLDVGETVQFAATPRDANGDPLSGRTITWLSSNTSLATVDGHGLVTGLAAGTTTITATSEGQSGTATISVPRTFRIFLSPAMDVGSCTNTARTNQTYDRGVLSIDGNGDFQLAWSETAPPFTSMLAVGHVTSTAFTATVSCANSTGPSGSWFATWSGTQYDGTYSFQGSTGSITVLLGPPPHP